MTSDLFTVFYNYVIINLSIKKCSDNLCVLVIQMQSRVQVASVFLENVKWLFGKEESYRNYRKVWKEVLETMLKYVINRKLMNDKHLAYTVALMNLTNWS